MLQKGGVICSEEMLAQHHAGSLHRWTLLMQASHDDRAIETYREDLNPFDPLRIQARRRQPWRRSHRVRTTGLRQVREDDELSSSVESTELERLDVGQLSPCCPASS